MSAQRHDALDSPRGMGCDCPMMQRHFRGQPRPGRRVEVRYRSVDPHADSPTFEAWTRNIGVGGAFIVTNDPPPVGTPLEVTLRLPGGRALVVRGEVRWCADGDDDPLVDMGVKFDRLSVEDTLALNEYFVTLAETVDHDEGG